MTLEHESRATPSLSIVFSFRNEASVLHDLVRRVRTALDPEVAKGHLASYEMVFVNDASTDSSLDILIEQARERDDIRILTTSRPFGVSPCVLAGMAYTTGDLVVYMDTDLQDPPEIIPQLVQVIREYPDVDVVHTQRVRRLGESAVKLLITRLGYSILGYFSSIQILPDVGDFKLLTRRVVKHLIQMEENNPFMRGLVIWLGFKQAIIPYVREARHSGDTKFPVLSTKVFRNFMGSALISFSDAPLQLSTTAGVVASLTTVAVLIHVLIEKMRGHNLPGWTAIMVALLFVSSVQLMSLGILGLYINAIFLASRSRPNYILNSTFGIKEPRTEIVRETAPEVRRMSE